ncbi:molybdate transport system ATP-binding protein [Paenalcaligenes hominis]|uniref:Molybdate transport system ATP-binding protein n=1 Tax=Paenalcaligenes hominis TaxID=643674 RepID=A0ABX0WQL3_9BURK|nr:ATP-binding cassette domain-containing protein [Paenalcaligenes hominis]NJB64679.1 molybdate transport system ATP-binding protein [Paenalcaligenes hominis]GGE59940.1 ABC transporter ATP-binding protein [Paenalcaligenes hominis]
MSVYINIQRALTNATREFLLDIKLETQAHRIALFGPSGSGKTLTIQAVSGLMSPDSGEIRVNDKLFFCSATGINMPPQERQLAYLLQDYGLFPHLTVAQNISFGLKRGWLNPAKKWVPDGAKRWVDAFDLHAILGNYPYEISGGQKQRTALARALAVSPELLLLDEPLAALDMDLRVRMRQELSQLQKRLDIPSIIITHDPEDAIVLADEVYRIADGKIQGRCTPEELSQEIELSSERLAAELQRAAVVF